MPATLGKLILALRQQLQSSSSDPRPSLELLDHLLLDPIAADLADAAKASPDGIPTLLWSLDGNLRYIPVSALYDSKQPDGHAVSRRSRPQRGHQLGEPDAPRRSPPLQTPSALLRSASRTATTACPALTGVTVELDSVARDPERRRLARPHRGQALRQ
jgi:CHAT domain-containing protein